MSLVAFAIRQTLKRTLVGKTYAEDRVFDSMVTPIDQKVVEGQVPLIIVYTDDDEATVPAFRINQPDKRALDVIVEMAIASKLEVVNDAVELTIPHTDAGLEAALAFMGRQVFRALSDPEDPWADLFRTFVTSGGLKVTQRRGAGTDKGTRFSARQIIFSVDPAHEPYFGEDPAYEPWGRLIELMGTDEELAPFGDLLAAEIKGAALPSWQVVQASLGLSQTAMRAGLALGPVYENRESDPNVVDYVTGEPPLMTTGILDNRITSDPDEEGRLVEFTETEIVDG